MAEPTTAARPYAKAVFETAQGEGRLEAWSEMLVLMAAVAHDGSMRALLDSPRLGEDEQTKLVTSVCAEHIDDKARNFVRLLADNRRLSLLPEIAALYEHMRHEAEGTLEAEVISAFELDQPRLDSVAEALKKRMGRKITLTSRTDPSLLGGAIIRAGDLVIDGSIRGRLDKLAGSLTR